MCYLYEKIFFELLIGHEYFLTEREYSAVKSDSFIIWIQADFYKLLQCEQTHLPITMVA